MANDRETIADEIERLHKLATPAPWSAPPGVEPERVRGWIWSRCKGFPPEPVGQMSGQETSAEREANRSLTCLLRSHVPEILAALRSKDREDGAREMRERAEAACLKNSEQIDPQCVFDSGFGAGLGQAAVIVAALPLHPTPKGDGTDA